MSDIVWAEVDLKAIAHNVCELRRVTSPRARLMAVVKANGYGHGAPEVAARALQSGADMLGVARLNEGIRLRKSGIDVPILVFGYPNEIEKLIEFDLTQTVCSYNTAEILSQTAVLLGKRIKIHFKIDTGMGRVGLVVSCQSSCSGQRTTDNRQLTTEIESAARLPGVELEGIFTHFASSDSSDKSFAKRQFELFTDFLDPLRVDIPVKHAANSGAIIDLPETHLDMVRAGISLYGLYPSDEVKKSRITLKPAMALKARIVQLKKVPADFSISYGMTYRTEKPTTIATVPIGYADGFSRLLSSRGVMLVRGIRAPIVGRVCMDMTMIDVGHIPDVRLEDEVVIFGRQGDSVIAVDEIASDLHTINYEVVSSITARVPRIYLQ